MVEFMQEHEGVSHRVAVEHRDGFVFGRVAAENVLLAAFRQAYLQFRHVYLVVLCQKRKGLFCFSIQNQPDNQWFEVGLQCVSPQLLVSSRRNVRLIKSVWVLLTLDCSGKYN